MNHEAGLILTNLDLLRVIDGDTIELSITRKFKVRIRNVDAFELSQDKGNGAKLFVEGICYAKDPPEITLFIPSNKPEQLLDFYSFDRVVGDLIINGFDIAEELKKAGYDKNESKPKMSDK